jgi:hypothetical protein
MFQFKSDQILDRAYEQRFIRDRASVFQFVQLLV